MFRITIFFFISSFSLAQEQKAQITNKNIRIVDFDDIYIEDELLYEYDSEKLYTGLIHRRKKNGKLIQEQHVGKGIINYTLMFYRRKNIPYSKYIYNKKKPFVLSKKLRYHLEGDVFEIIYYDDNGKKILEEDYEGGKLIYSCEFNGRKRHGKEFCITKECDTAFVFYTNGRKQRSKAN